MTWLWIAAYSAAAITIGVVDVHRSMRDDIERYGDDHVPDSPALVGLHFLVVTIFAPIIVLAVLAYYTCRAIGHLFGAHD